MMNIARNHIKILFTAVFLLIIGAANAQIEVDEQLALQFYQNKEYDKAAEIYQRIYQQKPSPFYYNYYLESLFELKDYKTAKKFVSSVAHKHPDKIKYKVEEAYVLQRWGKVDKAKKQYNYLIKKLGDNRQKTIDLSEAFTVRNLNSYAVKCLEKSKKKIKNPPLNIELAQLYFNIGNFDAMAIQYLDMVVIDDDYISTVKNKLQLIITDASKEKATEAIRTELLKRTQKSNSNTIYSELLYWFSVQKKDFELALIQAKALDKQFNEQGSRVFELANIFMSNKEWSLAVDAYSFVINIGPESQFYMAAEIKILDARFNNITQNSAYTKQELLDLESDYKVKLKAFGKNANTSRLMMNLAHIQAFYLNDLESAKVLLKEVGQIPNISKQQKAKAKLQLADMKLFSGEKWSASLLYKQVEKENKHDAIGYLAKYKAAKFYYYVGEMEWAKSQLDVLRGATSKLIANNAMKLYLLIQENISPDSTYDVLAMYAKADLLTYQKNYKEAILILDTIINIFPNHPIIDDSYFKKAEIAMREQKYEAADSLLEQTADYDPFGTLADNAILQRAKLYDNILNDKAKASELYQKILIDYPGSLFTIEARKRYREINGE